MDFEKFIDEIVLDNLYKEAINNRIVSCIRRIELQFAKHTVSVLVPYDFIAYIIGELNGMFNAWSMLKIVRNMNIKLDYNNKLIIFNNLEDNSQIKPYNISIKIPYDTFIQDKINEQFK